MVKPFTFPTRDFEVMRQPRARKHSTLSSSCTLHLTHPVHHSVASAS